VKLLVVYNQFRIKSIPIDEIYKNEFLEIIEKNSNVLE